MHWDRLDSGSWGIIWPYLAISIRRLIAFSGLIMIDVDCSWLHFFWHAALLCAAQGVYAVASFSPRDLPLSLGLPCQHANARAERLAGGDFGALCIARTSLWSAPCITSHHILSGNATTAAPFGARNSRKCNILQQHWDTSRLCVFAEFPEFSFLWDSILTSWIDFKHQAIEKQGPAIWSPCSSSHPCFISSQRLLLFWSCLYQISFWGCTFGMFQLKIHLLKIT